MADRDPELEQQHGGLSEALRDAVERTFAATAGPLSQTRERAGELLDEVSRRGADARGAVGEAGRAVTRRGQRAGRAPRELARRALGALRPEPEGDERELEALRAEVKTLRRRVAELERER